MDKLLALLVQGMAGLGKALVVLAEDWDRLEVLGHYHNGQDK